MSRTSHIAAATRQRAGFTLIELMIVVAIVSVAAALAIPSMSTWAENQRLAETSQVVETALDRARSESVRTGNIYLVFFSADTLGAPLVDAAGATVHILVVDDGLPGSANQNCLIDAGEAGEGWVAEAEVNLGVTDATVKVPQDTGTGDFTTGSTFTDASAAAATWVMFRPDGTTRAFSSDCSTGAIGSGGGGIYVTNGNRDLATVLTPLGSSRTRSWDDASTAWGN